MKTKTLSLMLTSVLALVVLSAFGSAASLDLTLVSAPTTAIHNSDVTVTFNVTNGGVTNYTSLNWSGSTTNIGTWKTLPTLTSLVVGETKTLTAVLNIPSHSSGTVISQIDLQSETTAEAQLNIPSITINESKALSVSSSTIQAGSNSTTIVIENTGNVDLTNIALNASGSFGITFSTNGFNLAKGASQTVTVTSSSIENLLSGSSTITAATTGVSATGTITLESNFCDISTTSSNFDISIDDINNEGFGDEETWYPLDKLSIDVLVENTGDEKINDILIEWGLYNTETKDWIGKKYKESKFDLKSDSEKTVTLELTLDQDVKDLASGNFILYVKANAEDLTGDNFKFCESVSQTEEIVISSSFVALSDITLTEEVSCGSEVAISADVWNIGDSDEDDVSVEIISKELGLLKKVDIGSIDSLDKEKLDTTITIPENALEKSYQLTFKVYDEDGDIFVSDDDDDSIFTKALVVSGSCVSAQSKATVSATLESGGKSGSPLVIKATISNTGASLATYTISAANFADWADSADVNTPTLVLGPGDSKDVQITLNVKKGISGEQTFKVEISSGSDLLVQQPVAVSIEKAGFLSGITGNVIGGGNSWYIWVIGAVNVLLVVIIIVVALRIARH